MLQDSFTSKTTTGFSQNASNLTSLAACCSLYVNEIDLAFVCAHSNISSHNNERYKKKRLFGGIMCVREYTYSLASLDLVSWESENMR